MNLNAEQKEAIIEWCLSEDQSKGILEDCAEFQSVEDFRAARIAISDYIVALREKVMKDQSG